MTRKILGFIIGLVIIIGALLFAKSLIQNKKLAVKEVPKTVKTVYTEAVKNTNIPIVIKANGNLVASRKIELFSEVQGIFLPPNKPFKAGQYYHKGDVLVEINSREFYTSLIAQRSTLFDLISAMMPDLRFDYPESFNQWQVYIKNFDLNKNISSLPEPLNEKEKYFVNGRKVVSTYYNIKNLEERLSKYKIRAPYSGILTEALINPGTLIRSGQKMGELIDNGEFELEVNVNGNFKDALKIGEAVKLKNLAGTKEWTGIVKRINGRIDQNTQTVMVFIGVKGTALVEGMYMEAFIDVKSEQNAFQVARNLMINENQLYAVEENKLILKTVNPVFFTEKTAVVKGLSEGLQLLTRPIPGAYSGMVVKIAENVEK